jgi:hypothetical protein
MGAGAAMVCRLARAPDDRHARHNCALASTGLAPVLALFWRNVVVVPVGLLATSILLANQQ